MRTIKTADALNFRQSPYVQGNIAMEIARREPGTDFWNQQGKSLTANELCQKFDCTKE